MHKLVSTCTILIGTLILFTFSSVYASSIPSSIGEIIEELAEIEEGFENNKWEEALEATEKVEKELAELSMQAKLQDELLVTSLSDLKKEILNNDQEKTEIKYLLFQKKFFSFINNFEFDVHPLFPLLEKYVVEEASEALEKDDFDDVASEMAEAGNLIKHVEPLLLEKGVAEQEIKDFTSEVVAVIQAAKKGDKVKTSEHLMKVQNIYNSFLTRVM